MFGRRKITGSLLGCLTLVMGLVSINGSSPAGAAQIPMQASALDNEPPEISITNPRDGYHYTSLPPFFAISTYDNVGVVSVFAAIYRNVDGGQYWNGTGWQTANTVAPAQPIAYGPPNRTWFYTFQAPSSGVFAVAAIAYDAAGNFTVTPYRNFYVDDNIAPNVTLTTPTPSQAFATRPVSITGLATDDAGVGDVLIAIYRPTETGEFWNGTAWQASYTTVAATLENPGGNSTTYQYRFEPPQAGGYFYVAAIVLDTYYNYNRTPFTLFTLPDTIAPVASFKGPAAGTTKGTLKIIGAASDDIAVNRVGIAIYRATTGEYWDGKRWVTTFATVAATLTAPGSPATTFTLDYTPPAPDTYYIAAVASDGNYNYSVTPFTIVNHI
jgi:hypothetical protein